MNSTALREIDLAASRREWPRYPHFVPTGLTWLANAPSHWSAKRLRYAVRFPTKSEVRGLPLATSVSFIPMEAVGEYGGLALDQSRLLEEVLNGYTYFRNQDVVVAKITPCFENGKGAIAEALHNGIGFGTTELHVIRAGPELLPRFLLYLTFGEHFRKLGEAEMYGAGGQKRVPEWFIRNLRHPLPPLDEQKLIADFLDRETARIDRLIAKKKRLIELLEIKRRTIIEHAVTRGLSKHVPMKAVDIGWLKSVPAHWKIYRIANLFRDVSEPGNKELPILSVSIHAGISDEQIADEDMERKVLRSEDKSKYIRVVPGDLVYNMMRAWQGGFGAAKVEGMVSPAYVVARPIAQVPTQFIEHLLRTPNAVEEMRRNSYGVADFRLRLYWDQFKNIRLPLPPTEEAEDICRFIDGVCLSAKRVTDVACRTIGALQQLRASLITAAVTGQIDVRNYRRETT